MREKDEERGSLEPRRPLVAEEGGFAKIIVHSGWAGDIFSLIFNLIFNLFFL